jgi:heat shock protein HslJ
MKNLNQSSMRAGVAAAAAVMMLVGCATTEVAGPAPQLSGSRWTVARVDGRAPVGSDLLTAEFGVDGRINGDSGCNGYSGPYIQTGSTVRIGELLSTRRACTNDDRQQQESRVLRILQGANTIRREGDGRISLTSEGGTLVLSPVTSVSSTVPSGAPYPRRAMYDCDGVALTVVFEERQAALTWSGGHDVLEQRTSGSGYWYESPRNTVRGTDILTWTQDGRTPRRCEVLR